MRVNADLTKPARLDVAGAQWTPSPLPGVDRLMLDRVGDEVARATTIVRYARGSRFTAHSHDAGEEFLVLDGVFSDASGDFGPGSYVRNPPGSAHAPWSENGCTIFVKLRQFDDNDRARIVIDTTRQEGWREENGASIRPLHEYGAERVFMARLAPGAEIMLDLAGGAEMLLLEGAVTAGGESAAAQSWLRFPPGKALALKSAAGARAWIKTGHINA